MCSFTVATLVKKKRARRAKNKLQNKNKQKDNAKKPAPSNKPNKKKNESKVTIQDPLSEDDRLVLIAKLSVMTGPYIPVDTLYSYIILIFKL